MATVVRVNERVRVKNGKFKDAVGKITLAREEGRNTRCQVVTDSPLPTHQCGLNLPAIFWVDFDDLELLEPFNEVQEPLPGHGPFPDDETLFEAELYMEEDERAEWNARIQEIEAGRKLYGCDG